MSTPPTRSEQVVADFKQRRLAQSAFRRIQDKLREFEEERAFDLRAARAGVIAVALLLVVSFYLLLSGNSSILN
jgi:hypothetical protein